MKVFEICEMATVNTKINVVGNNDFKGLRYTVPDLVSKADKEIMDMEAKVIEVQFGELVIHVGNIEFR